MNVVNQSEDINVNVSLIFDLINNVDKYSSFLPWCSNSSILSNSSSEMTAEIEIAGKPITWKFKTKNNYKVNEIIKIKLVDGPFKNLEGYWKFNSIDDHNTSVSLFLEYEFNSKIIELSLKPIFATIMSSILDSFISEAFRIKNEKQKVQD
tara:strand:- start:7491 stop:7943 length:453 start_codon:yes stop_codon:yes gene_type:complete